MIQQRLALAFLATTLCLTAQDLKMPEPKGYSCGKIMTPIVIDGKLDDTGWRNAPWTEDFVDILGDQKPRPRYRTRAKMAWDENFFYVAAELMEPHVWGVLTKHDSVIFQDNDFEVFIDPDGDNHEYYEIEINALNTEWDLLLEKPYRDGGPAIDSWEIPGLKTATHVNGTINDPRDEDQSWTVEIAIPWKALGSRANRPVPPHNGDQWRVNFSRVEWEQTNDGKNYVKVPKKPEDNWVWSPQGVVDMHRPSRWGYLQFSSTPPGTEVYRPDPSGPIRDRLMMIYKAQRAYHQKNNRWATQLKELEMGAELPGLLAEAPHLRITPQGYEVEITMKSAQNHPAQTWVVRQDSRLTKKTDGK